MSENGKDLCAGGEWTVNRFFGFLRSNLRLASRKWPPLARLALQDARRPYRGENKRQKWEYRCSNCGEWFKGTEVQVDHKEPCGPLKCYEDLEPFCRRLFVEKEDLRVLCRPCHQIVTKGEVLS